MDRDIRLTADEIIYLDRAAGTRIRALNKKIETAQARRAVGDHIQNGTLEAHMKEREVLSITRGYFAAAQKHFADLIRSNLGIDGRLPRR